MINWIAHTDLRRSGGEDVLMWTTDGPLVGVRTAEGWCSWVEGRLEPYMGEVSHWAEVLPPGQQDYIFDRPIDSESSGPIPLQDRSTEDTFGLSARLDEALSPLQEAIIQEVLQFPDLYQGTYPRTIVVQLQNGYCTVQVRRIDSPPDLPARSRYDILAGRDPFE